jgi:hypothetical protein
MSPRNNSAKPGRTERKFPALTFEESIVLPEAIQKFSAGQRVRRLTLFEKLDKDPGSKESRRLITSSGQYGLTKGGYNAEYLELTSEGSESTSDEVSKGKQLSARFKLAIEKIPSFRFLYEKIKGNKIPAKEVLADYLEEQDLHAE